MATPARAATRRILEGIFEALNYKTDLRVACLQAGWETEQGTISTISPFDVQVMPMLQEGQIDKQLLPIDPFPSTDVTFLE
jgi:hypothetical protein